MEETKRLYLGFRIWACAAICAALELIIAFGAMEEWGPWRFLPLIAVYLAVAAMPLLGLLLVVLPWIKRNRFRLAGKIVCTAGIMIALMACYAAWYGKFPMVSLAMADSSFSELFSWMLLSIVVALAVNYSSLRNYFLTDYKKNDLE